MASYRLEAAPDGGQTSVKIYDARGVVRQIAEDRRKANIQHGAIAGYMSAMTMEFNVKDTNELDGISPSDQITFKLDVGEKESWIEDVHFVAHQIEDVTNNTFVFHVPTAELKPGDLLPDCELVAEDLSLIHILNQGAEFVCPRAACKIASASCGGVHWLPSNWRKIFPCGSSTTVRKLWDMILPPSRMIIRSSCGARWASVFVGAAANSQRFASAPRK